MPNALSPQLKNPLLESRPQYDFVTRSTMRKRPKSNGVSTAPLDSAVSNYKQNGHVPYRLVLTPQYNISVLPRHEAAPEYDAACTALNNLHLEDEEFAPTSYAFTIAWNMLRRAYIELQSAFPKVKVVPDGQGGIEIYFNQPVRQVHLVIPGSSKRRPFLYVGSEHGPRTFANADGDMLTFHLRWLQEA